MSQAITDNLLQVLKDRLGSAWEQLSTSNVELLKAVATDAAKLQVQALSTPPGDTAAIAALASEAKEIDAQLANIAAGGAGVVRTEFWAAANAVAETALKVLIKVAVV